MTSTPRLTAAAAKHAATTLVATVATAASAVAIGGIPAMSVTAAVATAQETQPDASTPVVEEFVEVRDDDGAVLKIQRNVESGGTFRLEGTGWGANSRLAIKLNRGDSQAQRTGDDVLLHPGNGKPDSTLWALIDADGSGNVAGDLDLPDDLTAGEPLRINAASGLRPEDARHTMTSPYLVVGGVEYVPPVVEKIECVSTVDAPEARVVAGPDADGRLTIVGDGFCNSESGGARIAIKINDGAVSRLDDSVHSNKTVWAIIDAEPTTGHFEAVIDLPTAETAGAALPEGEHYIRVLSGSLKDGDPVVSLPKPRQPKLSFIVGEYKPAGLPDPLEYNEGLRDDLTNGVEATVASDNVVVTSPNSEPGDWVYASVYVDTGSVRLPWGQEWFQLDDDKSLALPITDDVPAGKLKLVLQSGNKGEISKLVGWTFVELRAEAETGTSNVGNGNSRPSSNGTTGASAASGTGRRPASADNNPGLELYNAMKEVNGSLKSINKDMATIAKEIPRIIKAENPATDKKVERNPAPVRTQEATSGDKKVVRRVIRRSSSSGVQSLAGQPVQSVSTAALQRSVQQAVSRPASVQSNSLASSGSQKTSTPSKPKPTSKPKPPVAKKSELKKDKAGQFVPSFTGNVLVIKADKAGLKPGDWVYLHVYSDKRVVDAGWVQVDSSSSIRFDTSTLPDGSYAVSISDTDRMLGWLGLNLGQSSGSGSSGSNNAASGNGVFGGREELREKRAAQVANSSRLMTGADWTLIGLSLLIPALTAGAVWYSMKRHRDSVVRSLDTQTESY